MIKISDELLSAFKSTTFTKSDEDFFKEVTRITKEMKEENEALYDTLLKTAINVANEFSSENDYANKELTINCIWIGACVYNLIKQQLISNDLQG